MLDQLRTASNIEEIAKVFLEFWENGTELDSFSAEDINEFRKILLSRNLFGLAKKLTPPEAYEFNRFNLTRAVISEINPETVMHQKLKFAVWQRLITNRTISFMAKTTNADTQKKLNLLLVSLKSLAGLNQPLGRTELAKRFVILSDLASQLGYEMFSLIAAKKSLQTDPEYLDAAVFIGRAYLELGSAFARKNERYGDFGAGTFQYNLQKSSEIFISALEKMSGSQRQQVSDLVASISGVLTEIERQKKQGRHAVVHVVVEDYIKDKMEKVENAIMAGYENSKVKFAANIHTEESISQILTATASEIRSETTAQGDDLLTVIKELPPELRRVPESQPVIPKTGKLYNIYNQQSEFKPETPKTGSVTSDEIGYKLKLEDILKAKIKEKNDEIFNKKS